MNRILLSFSTALLFGNWCGADPIQVFVLAGQSNMEGKAKLSLLEYQAAAPETRDDFAHLREDNKWIERDDVWIKFLDRHGKLTVGYGSRNCIGPELEFGWVMGDHFEQPVILIKTAWGGKSLYRDFRPPSSGLPDNAELTTLLEKARKKNPNAEMETIRDSFGLSYRNMVQEIRETLEHLGDLFPEYKGEDYQLGGMVWFQGWNDMVNPAYVAAYAQNMENFIRDVRQDLQAPDLPFVIGQLGVGGVQEAAIDVKKRTFQQAQVAAAQLPEFRDNVLVVKTDQYWDTAADTVYRKGWKEHLEEWNRVGSDYPFHYLGSAKTYSRIGRAFAEALLNRERAPAFYDPIVKRVEGWTVRIDPMLFADDNQEVGQQALKALSNHLQRVRYIVEDPQLAQLMTLPIWLELNNPRLGPMQYHPSRGWLLANGHDPRLAKHVHIPRAEQLFDRKTWAKHPYVVLHELAHAYHDQKLGFDNSTILSVFEDAKAEGIYDKVLLYTGKQVRHYGLSDHKEYFAESTEAYLGVNDFYPFVRAELERHDPKMFEVMKDVWGKLP